MNRWIISLDANSEMEIEIFVGRIKFFVATTSNNNLNNINNNIHEEPVNKPETDISRESEKEEKEVNVNNQNEILQLQFFEHFLPVGYIMSTVLSSTNEHARASEYHWKNITWMEFMQFIDILT
ncbi:hypothetical protein Glove_196g27 [Diversispora epigaea]|uniref:PiggyBac transposable element-derived protein domain-containing protein n=1 Tax=Diversispora epigaea TaxID=1348612 RepID=A0A397IP46_9GLOM|nr:hypothetical protein Glove_196g27 [Diversispora epigaea]